VTLLKISMWKILPFAERVAASSLMFSISSSSIGISTTQFYEVPPACPSRSGQSFQSGF
jgi:hypothetical protein